MCTRATFAGLPILGAAALFALGCADSVTSEHRPHPGPAFALAAVPVAGHTLYVPSGFSVNLFAEGLGNARSLALAPDGSVFVTLSWDDGEIDRLVDADGDGVADERSTVLSGLSFPFGLAFRGDTMYFAEETAVRRLDPGATTPVTLVSNLPPGGHLTRTIAFGPDNLLYVAGDLDTTMSGPDIDNALGLKSKRRSIYLRQAAEKEVEFLKIFDGPAVTECYVRRPTVVPQQALAMANSELTLNMVKSLAKKLAAECGADNDLFARRVFERILARHPRPDELNLCRQFLLPNEDVSTDRSRENLVSVLFNHNDFITVR